MIAVALLGLVLSVDGHHPLPAAPSPAACRTAAAGLRVLLQRGRRPQRLRALTLLKRCSFTVDLAPLLSDPDRHIRHAGILFSLSLTPLTDRRWAAALQSASPLERAAILRIRSARRMALQREAR